MLENGREWADVFTAGLLARCVQVGEGGRMEMAETAGSEGMAEEKKKKEKHVHLSFLYFYLTALIN